MQTRYNLRHIPERGVVETVALRSSACLGSSSTHENGPRADNATNIGSANCGELRSRSGAAPNNLHFPAPPRYSEDIDAVLALVPTNVQVDDAELDILQVICIMSSLRSQPYPAASRCPSSMTRARLSRAAKCCQFPANALPFAAIPAAIRCQFAAFRLPRRGRHVAGSCQKLPTARGHRRRQRFEQKGEFQLPAVQRRKDGVPGRRGDPLTPTRWSRAACSSRRRRRG